MGKIKVWNYHTCEWEEHDDGQSKNGYRIGNKFFINGSESAPPVDNGLAELKTEETEWKCEESKTYDSCPHTMLKVVVPLEIMYKVAYLSRKTEGEFFCYLKGKIRNSTAVVLDIYVPEQEAAYASVEVTEKNVDLRNVIGTLHKHSGAGTPSHSVTDYDYMNYAVMIIVDSNGDNWKCYSRHKTPCGCFLESEPVISFTMPSGQRRDTKAMLKKIKKKEYMCGFVQGNETCPYALDNTFAECLVKSYRTCKFNSIKCPWSGVNDRLTVKEDRGGYSTMSD